MGNTAAEFMREIGTAVDALGLDVGQQVRVRRNDDEYAAYTISETRQELADETVRMGRRVRVGGGASEETKTEISNAINAVLPDSAPDAVVARGRYAATDEDVLVNRLSGGDGIWIGQPEDVRANHGEAVAKAVADVANRRV